MKFNTDVLGCPTCHRPMVGFDYDLVCKCCQWEIPAITGIWDLVPLSLDHDSRYTLEIDRYEKVAAAGPGQYHGLADTNPAWRASMVRDLLFYQEVKQFVNLGPGFGELEAKCHNEFEIISMDSCLGFLAHIKKQMPKVHCVRGVAEYLPFQDESVECFVSQSTFQSIVDRVRFLYEVGRVMAPGSLFLLTVAYKWNYPRKPQDGFNILKYDERQTLNLFLDELGFDTRYEIFDSTRMARANTLDEGNYFWIIGTKR